MSLANRPTRRLIVHLKDGPERTLSLDYADVAELERQLATFERQRKSRTWGRRPGELYEFRNGAGDVIAFIDECFIREEVIELEPAGNTR